MSFSKCAMSFTVKKTPSENLLQPSGQQPLSQGTLTPLDGIMSQIEFVIPSSEKKTPDSKFMPSPIEDDITCKRSMPYYESLISPPPPPNTCCHPGPSDTALPFFEGNVAFEGPLSEFTTPPFETMDPGLGPMPNRYYPPPGNHCACRRQAPK